MLFPGLGLLDDIYRKVRKGVEALIYYVTFA
jgi:hypothetical protein